MVDFVHRLKVFVYRFRSREPDYLLLRAHGAESLWGPVQGSIGFGEKIDTAIRRELGDDVGLARATDLRDLGMPALWDLGIEKVVEWCYGVRAPADHSSPQLGPRWSEYLWAPFPQAYPALELETDRAILLRLHHLLHQP